MVKRIEGLIYLSNNERLAVQKLIARLTQEQRAVLQIILYGSGARGERREDSDVDLLILINSDDWRDHEPIRYLAASLSNQYDIFLSPKVMGINHFQRLKREFPLFYENVRREGVELYRAHHNQDFLGMHNTAFVETE